MVEREDLPNAIALNSTLFNLATVVGPAAGGLVYASVGPAWCFAVNGLTFVAVIAALTLMRLKRPDVPLRVTAPLDDLKEGLRYISSNVVIRTLIGVAAVMSLFGLAYTTLIPAWAVTVLGGDAMTNGWLQSARGAGALAGALMIASLGRFKFKGKLLSLGTFTFPAFILIFSSTQSLPLSLAALAGVGWGFMILFNMINVLIQTVVPDDLRGRVVSVYTLSFFGLMPIGAVLAGWAAELIGEPITILSSALVPLCFALLVYKRVPELHRLE
jgi:MFS family permease